MTVPAVPPSGRVARRLDFFVFFLGFALAVFTCAAARFDFPVSFVLSFAAPVALVLAALAVSRQSRIRTGIAAGLGALVASAAWGIAMPPDPSAFLLRSNLYAPGSVLPNSPVESDSSHDFTADVAEIERRTPAYVRALVRIRSVDGAWAPPGLSAVAFFDPRADLSPWDGISLRTRWRIPSGYDSPSYRRYLLGRGVRGSFSVREYDRLGNRASSLDGFFAEARLRVRSLARELYPSDTAALALGILTGDRAEMPDELRDRFTRAGLSHLLVVSGFNVAILAFALSWLLGFLPLGARTGVVCSGILAFVLLVGPDPPVVRAGVSGALVYLAVAAGRSFRSLPLLSAVAVAMLLFDPSMLALDPSFQLSFLAVAGLVLGRDLFARIFRRVPAALGMRESLVITFSALVATFPVTALSFGQVSLVAPFSNLLAAPLAASATVLGAASLALWAWVPSVGYLAGFLEDLLLRALLLVARLGDLPFASVPVDFGGFSPLFATYFLLAGLLALYHGFAEDPSSSRSKNRGS